MKEVLHVWYCHKNDACTCFLTLGSLAYFECYNVVYMLV